MTFIYLSISISSPKKDTDFITYSDIKSDSNTIKENAKSED